MEGEFDIFIDLSLIFCRDIECLMSFLSKDVQPLKMMWLT